ncbi:unnamed protein product [Symbiodinium natans]|uniref:Uncharacterized protein n=1 Tax=Symbiodinium natans TaxID=878477 RepID=A0A812GFF0_9DINO|nr:unnamed protein product [Symbiodinium natans]
MRWSEDAAYTAYLADPQCVPTSFAMILFKAGSTMSGCSTGPKMLYAVCKVSTPPCFYTLLTVYCIVGPMLPPDIVANIGGQLKVIAGVRMAIKVSWETQFRWRDLWAMLMHGLQDWQGLRGLSARRCVPSQFPRNCAFTSCSGGRKW